MPVGAGHYSIGSVLETRQSPRVHAPCFNLPLPTSRGPRVESHLNANRRGQSPGVLDTSAGQAEVPNQQPRLGPAYGRPRLARVQRDLRSSYSVAVPSSVKACRTRKRRSECRVRLRAMGAFLVSFQHGTSCEEQSWDSLSMRKRCRFRPRPFRQTSGPQHARVALCIAVRRDQTCCQRPKPISRLRPGACPLEAPLQVPVSC